ncbi:MAG: RDD family protein [Pirellulaceae bacterium]|nr:RDD family protein [Pirellulaceae bacterium]
MQADVAQIDTKIEVVTPENIAFHYQVAGPARRAMAFLIDLVIRLGILFGVGCLTAVFGIVAGGVAILGYLIAYFLLDWFYGALFETFMNGQTPGKRVLGIRVLTVDGQPINGLQAVIRNVLRSVDLMPVLSLEMFGIPAPMYIIPTFMVGLVIMATNRRFQRLGDLVCRTMVVMEERQWLAGVARLDDPRAMRLADYLPADFQITRTLAQALAHYVERRGYYSEARRREVARHLGEPLLRQFGLPHDTSHDLLLCALYYRAFVADVGDEARRKVRQGESPFGPPDATAAAAAAGQFPRTWPLPQQQMVTLPPAAGPDAARIL